MNKKFITLVLGTLFILVLALIIVFEKSCGLSNSYNLQKNYNMKYLYYSCTKNSKNFIKTKFKNFISNSPFELIIRRYDKKQIQKSYSFLENKYFDKDFHKNSKSTIPDKVDGINNNLEKYLKEKKNVSKEFDTWKRSHGGYRNLKYNNSTQNISVSNINNHSLVWEYASIKNENINQKWKDNVEANPIYHNEKIYFISADRKLIAINAKNGSLLWEKQSILNPSRRGFVLETEGENSYIYFNSGGALTKVDANNGILVPEFGNNGIIYNLNFKSPPIIYKDRVYVVSSSSKIISIDKKSGKIIQRKSIHPKKKSFLRGGSPWSGNAFDDEKGYLYIVTGNPRPALVGIDRPGDNKNANSVIAVDLNSFEIIWKFQDVFHDLWDFDIAAPPIIADIKYDDKYLEVVIITTKTGNIYLLERNEGKSLFDLTFKKAPISFIPGEKASPYQRNNLIPEKLINVEYSSKNFDSSNQENLKHIKKTLRNAAYGWFETPRLGKKLIIFGLHGGATWMGSAYDPINNILFTPSINVPWILKVEGRTLSKSLPIQNTNFYKTYNNLCSSCHGKFRNGTFDPESKKNVEILNDYIPGIIGHSLSLEKNLINEIYEYNNFLSLHKNLNIKKEELKNIKSLMVTWDKELLNDKEIFLRYFWYKHLDTDNNPASNKPWGEIIAHNLYEGNILWKSKTGYEINREKPKLIGTPSYGGLALSEGGILFTTGTNDGYVYGIDKKNGEIVWEYKMDAAGSAPPIIYSINGKQYITIISTGGLFSEYKEKASKIYTFTIKD